MSEQATYHPLARDTEFGHQDNSSQTGVFIAEFSNDEVTFGKIPASNTPNKRYCICATTGVEHRIQSCDASDIAYSAFACVKRVIFVNVDGTADMLRYNGSLYTVAFVPHALQVVCELVSTGFQGSEVVILTDFTAQAELQKHVLENFTCWCKGHDRNTDEHDMGDRLSGIQMFSMTDMQVVSNEVVIYCSTASNEFDRHHNQSNLFWASCVARSMVVIVGDVRDSNPTRHEYPTSAHAACKWCRWNNSVVDTNRSSADHITSMVQRGFFYSKFNIAGIIDAFCAHDRLSTE
ncbi:hypothetical protein PTNB73_10214 [Pyrenophora teres f. teres]|nr:hypothetical protein HRS9122_00015 [Pyrenophora teres f. teres]KAE8855557.1 hypothetical protein PTNB73_10214 [Pyrenophora teres f. teres]